MTSGDAAMDPNASFGRAGRGNAPDTFSPQARERLLDAVLKGADAAGWECGIDKSLSVIDLTCPMGRGGDYSFSIAYEPGMDSVLLWEFIDESIGEEAGRISSSDFVSGMRDRDPDFETDEEALWAYAVTLQCRISALGEKIADAVEKAMGEGA